MLLWRRIFFYLFTAIYVIACPLTILYALGYILKPGSEQGLVRTGLIYLASVPHGASVYISNKRYTQRTPAMLRNLLPGSYPVRLELKGYRRWTQDAPVEPEKATALEKILLLPSSLKRQEFSLQAFDRLIPIEKSRIFLLAAGHRPGNLFVFDVRQEKIRPLLKENDPFAEGKILSIYSVPASSVLVILVHVLGGEKYLRVEISEKESRVEDITPCFPEEPLEVQWDPHEKDILFSLHQRSVDRVDVPACLVQAGYLQNIRGFGVFNRDNYILHEDFLFERRDQEGKPKEILLNDKALGRALFGDKGWFQIKVLHRDIILFLGPAGELVASRLPYQFLERGAEGIQFYAPRQRVLVWRRSDIGILDFSKSEREETVFEKGPQLFWVFKRGRDIKQAFWVYEGSHILFRDGNQVFLLELETHGKPHLDPLLEVRRNTDVFYSESAGQSGSGKLYYLDPQTERLSAVEILPRQEILPFAFPEKKEKKKKVKIEEF